MGLAPAGASPMTLAFLSGAGYFAGIGIYDFRGGRVLLRPGVRAATALGLLEPIAVAVHGQYADVMRQAIKQSAGEPFRS